MTQATKESSMRAEIEAVIYTQDNVRVSVSEWDGGAWLHLQMQGCAANAALTREEAEQLVAGLQAILAVPA
jgi:hypothetical protein